MEGKAKGFVSVSEDDFVVTWTLQQFTRSPIEKRKGFQYKSPKWSDADLAEAIAEQKLGYIDGVTWAQRVAHKQGRSTTAVRSRVQRELHKTDA